MILRAAEEHQIDLASSWMIGDSESDIEAGRRAGCKTVLIVEDPLTVRGSADRFARSLLEASAVILHPTNDIP